MWVAWKIFRMFWKWYQNRALRMCKKRSLLQSETSSVGNSLSWEKCTHPDSEGTPLSLCYPKVLASSHGPSLHILTHKLTDKFLRHLPYYGVMVSAIYVYNSQVVFSLQIFRLNSCKHFSSSHAWCTSALLLLFIWIFEKRLVKIYTTKLSITEVFPLCCCLLHIKYKNSLHPIHTHTVLHFKEELKFHIYINQQENV